MGKQKKIHPYPKVVIESVEEKKPQPGQPKEQPDWQPGQVIVDEVRQV